jgi:pilus assembly protein Flp/PilA
MTLFIYKVAIRVLNDLRGQDLVEYALMAGFVAVAGGAVFPASIMPGVSTIFSSIESTMTIAAAS